MEATGDEMSSSLQIVDVTKELIESTFAPVLWLMAIELNHKVTVSKDENLHSVVEDVDDYGVTVGSVSNASFAAVALKIFDFHNKTSFM